MAEDFDLDRVINDPAYRRRVIARLNEPRGEMRRREEADPREVAAQAHRVSPARGAAAD